MNPRTAGRPARPTPTTPLLTALEQLTLHDHLCSIYERPEEHYTAAIPFIRIGLDRGEKCIYVADDGTEAVVRDAMYAEGIDVERAIATDRLVLEKKDAYLKHGSFDPEWMFAFWANAAAEAERAGFPALRVTGETDWMARGAPGLEQWMEYESRMTRTLSRLNASALCQYNRRLFPPEVVLAIIRTHPTVIYRGVVCRNMYHVPTEESTGPHRAEREVERLLANIWEREEVEHALRQQRDELRESEARSRQQLEDVRRADAALRSSEERWRLVFENSAIGIVLADPSGHFVEANRAFQELVGYTNEELQALTYRDITHEADLRRGAEGISELLSGAKREVQLEKRYRHKDGRFIWVRATGTVIPGGDRSPRYMLGLIEDVTDRRSARQELDASVRQLRALAGRLMHAQDDERRRIARMLHETTAQDLAALKMHLARLNRTAGDLTDTDRGVLTESIALAEQSITEIRTLSYLLHPPFLDETGLLSALRWYATGFAERSGISVDLDLPDSFERLPLDTETALFRIVQESLINVHRHAGSGTARIRLRADAGTLVLEIEDRGQGIPDASLAHIKGGRGGAGVGIPGMSERLEQLGGHLQIESSDQGTTVRARLPLASDAV